MESATIRNLKGYWKKQEVVRSRVNYLAELSEKYPIA